MRSTAKTAEASLVVLAVAFALLGACTRTPDYRSSAKGKSSPASHDYSEAKQSSLRKQQEQQRRQTLPQATSAPAGSLVAQPDPTAAPSWVNVTSPKQSGGGIVTARPDVRTEPGGPAFNAAGVQLDVPPRGPAERAAVLAAAQRVEEARRRLARGEVLQARTLLEAALDAVPAAALHELGRTFDPYYLGQLPTINDGSEPRRAATLYQEAIVHGSATAGYDLDRLRATHPGLR